MKKNEAISILATSVRPREQKDRTRYDEAVKMAVDALNEPERKTGKWIPQDHNKTNGMVSTVVYYYPKCSVCGHCANYTNFCPNCGARMVQEGERP